MDTATIFYGLGMVALLLLLQGRSDDSTIDPRIVVVCRRVTYIANGCNAIAFLTALLTFCRHP